MSDAEKTICASCANLWIVNKSDPYWRWLCRAVPLGQWENYVTGTIGADPPCQKCERVNMQGNCQMFVAGPNTLQPRTPPEE